MSRKHDFSLGGEEEEASIDLTPMLDVVFIMLIFFIVTVKKPELYLRCALAV